MHVMHLCSMYWPQKKIHHTQSHTQTHKHSETHSQNTWQLILVNDKKRNNATAEHCSHRLITQIGYNLLLRLWTKLTVEWENNLICKTRYSVENKSTKRHTFVQLVFFLKKNDEKFIRKCVKEFFATLTQIDRSTILSYQFGWLLPFNIWLTTNSHEYFGFTLCYIAHTYIDHRTNDTHNYCQCKTKIFQKNKKKLKQKQKHQPINSVHFISFMMHMDKWFRSHIHSHFLRLPVKK